MTEFLYRLGRRCADNGWRVIGIWFLVAFLIMGSNRLFGGESADSFILKGTDSSVAQDLLNRAFPGTSAEALPVVLHDPGLDFAAPEGERVVSDVAAEVEAIPQVTAVEAPADRVDLVSADGHTAIVSVTINERFATDTAVGQTLLDTAQTVAGPDVHVALGGFLGRQVSQPETRQSEALGLLSAIIILFLTLRRWGATFVPLASALFSVGLGLALVGLLSSLVFIPDVAPTLGTMLGLGVGIDYALFLLTRHRTLLNQGFEVPDAVGRTAGTAGAGMVFAGSTLIAAVCGLVLTGISFLAWLGYAAAIVVAIAVLASITLVPAILGVMKHRVMPKKPLKTQTDDDLDHTGWGRLADAVTSKPWRYAIASTVIMLTLAAPTVTLTLGHSDAGILPEETTARQAYDLVRDGFGPGENGPLAVVAQMYAIAEAPKGAKTGSGTDPRTQDPRLLNLQEQLAAAPGVVSADAPVVSPDGGVAIVRVVPQWGPADPRTEALVHQLRDNTFPAAVAGSGMGAHLGGVTAATTDFSEIIASRTPFFIAGVVSLSFLLLMLAYRSLLIPFKAACMNLISIAAAYGVVTMVFQWGWGAILIGLGGPVPIESYVPMMMFAVLFGLSMDYEVFLLTAFREHWERTGDMTTAVRRGLADTGRLVTAAALIMVVVFGSFLLSDNATVKMFGIGLATAVAVDATIVRCLLVPAIMVLAQKGTWWLPGWLDRLLPELHVEGDPRALDAASAQPSQPKSGRTPLALYRPAPVLGAVLGVGLSWLLTSRLSIIPDAASTAVAMSAVLGAVLALLPRAVGGGRGTFVIRAAGYTAGVLLALIVVSIITALVPPVSTPSAPVTAWAIVGTALLAVLVVGRSVALPMVLGSVALAVTYLVSGTGASLGSLLAAALLPAVVTILVISVFDNLFPDRRATMDRDRAQEPEPIRVGSP
ncbi:MAG: MMPL family transporter [Candidatus Nanopelagicales bacterium]